MVKRCLVGWTRACSRRGRTAREGREGKRTTRMHFVDVARIVALNFSKCHARYLSCHDGIGPRAAQTSTQGVPTASHLAPLLSQLSVCLDPPERGPKMRPAKKIYTYLCIRKRAEEKERKSDAGNATGISCDCMQQAVPETRRVIGARRPSSNYAFTTSNKRRHGYWAESWFIWILRRHGSPWFRKSGAFARWKLRSSRIFLDFFEFRRWSSRLSREKRRYCVGVFHRFGRSRYCANSPFTCCSRGILYRARFTTSKPADSRNEIANGSFQLLADEK